jgi:hypothetical protein
LNYIKSIQPQTNTMGGGLSKQPNKQCFYFGGRNYLLSKEKTDDYFWLSILKDKANNNNGNHPFIGGILYEYFPELGGYSIVKRWGNTKNKACIVLPCFGGKVITSLFTLVMFTAQEGFNGKTDDHATGETNDTSPENCEYILGCQILHRNVEDGTEKVDKNSWGVLPSEVAAHANGSLFEFSIRTNFDLFLPSYDKNLYRHTDVVFVIGRPRKELKEPPLVAVARMILDMQFSDDQYSLDRMRARICTHEEDKVDTSTFQDQSKVEKEFESLKQNFMMDNHTSGALVKLSKHDAHVDIMKSFYLNGLNFKGSFWLTVLKDNFANMNGNLPYIGGAMFSYNDETHEHMMEDCWGNTSHRCYVAIPLFGVNDRETASYHKYTLAFYTWEGCEDAEQRSASNNVAVLGCHITHVYQPNSTCLRKVGDMGETETEFKGFCWGVPPHEIDKYEDGSLFEFDIPLDSQNISTSRVTLCIGKVKDVDNQPVAVNRMIFDQLPRHYADTAADHYFEDNFSAVQGRIYTNREELAVSSNLNFPQQSFLETQFRKFDIEFASVGCKRASYRYRTRTRTRSVTSIDRHIESIDKRLGLRPGSSREGTIYDRDRSKDASHAESPDEVEGPVNWGFDPTTITNLVN